MHCKKILSNLAPFVRPRTTSMYCLLGPPTFWMERTVIFLLLRSKYRVTWQILIRYVSGRRQGLKAGIKLAGKLTWSPYHGHAATVRLAAADGAEQPTYHARPSMPCNTCPGNLTRRRLLQINTHIFSCALLSSLIRTGENLFSRSSHITPDQTHLTSESFGAEFRKRVINY
jgi:hypothetical protein